MKPEVRKQGSTYAQSYPLLPFVSLTLHGSIPEHLLYHMYGIKENLQILVYTELIVNNITNYLLLNKYDHQIIIMLCL